MCTAYSVPCFQLLVVWAQYFFFLKNYLLFIFVSEACGYVCMSLWKIQEHLCTGY